MRIHAPNTPHVRICALSTAALQACSLLSACQPGADPEPRLAVQNSAQQENRTEYALPPDADRPVRAQFKTAQAGVSQAREQGDSSLLALALGNLGMLFHAYDYPEPASVNYREAASVDPRDARWTYYLAHIERALGDYRSAADLFKKALELKPASTAAQVWLAESFFDAGDLDSAERGFKQALVMDPGCNHALAGLGKLALERGDYQQAITLLQRVVKLQPKVAALHYQLATAYRGMGDAATAIRYMENASRLQGSDAKLDLDDPMLERIVQLPVGHETVQMNALRALLDKDYESAARLYREAMSIQPQNPDNRYNLALALIQLGKVDIAIGEINTGLQKNPRDVDLHLLAARLYAGQNQNAMVEKHLLAAQDSDPQHPDVQLRLGNWYRYSNQMAMAATHYDRVLQLDDSVTDAYIGKALVLIRGGQAGLALDLLAEAVRNNPEDLRLRETYQQLRQQLAQNQ